MVSCYYVGAARRGKLARENESKPGQTDGYKTVCTVAVVSHFEVGNYHYAQTIVDIVRLLRGSGYSVRSRLSAIGRKCTVGKARDKIASGKLGTGKFVIRVDGHALLLDGEGKTIVDTDPRKRDRRRITHIYKVER